MPASTMQPAATCSWAPPPVLFGLLILLSAIVTWACFSMRRGVLATTLVALLWLLNTLVTLGGMGEPAGTAAARAGH